MHRVDAWDTGARRRTHEGQDRVPRNKHGEEARMKRRPFIAALLVGSIAAHNPSALAMDDGEVMAKSTERFNELQRAAEEQLAKTDFFSSLQPFSFGARVATPADVKAAVTIPNLGRGDPSRRYDIILQPGHYGRTSGKTGGSGAQVSEQQLVAFIAANIAKYLIDQHVDVLVIPADNFDKSGLNADVFLAIHADASDVPCKTGPSLGYASGSNLLGMHTIGFALATSMGQTYKDFMKDNFTVDEHKYYAFAYIKMRGYGGLLEVGELTCPNVEKSLITNALLISHNLGVALKASLDIIKEPLTPK
jgi:N-acetylmuramoyl-L-alanine amidase